MRGVIFRESWVKFLLAAIISFAGFSVQNSWAMELKAGTARTVITPQTNLKLTAGKLEDGTMLDMDGVIHDIYARALVLDDGNKRLVIVTHDISSLMVATPILRKRCKDELGIDPSSLLLIATHNHQCPMPRWGDNFPYMRWAADRMFDMIKQAIANEKGPVTVEFGSGQGYFVKASGNTPADYEIQVLKVSRKNKPVAVLFNHPTHPLMNGRTKVDVGHPGYACDEIERVMPGVLAMYGDACGGNQLPIAPNGKPGSIYTMDDQSQKLGLVLANIVLNITKGKMTDVTGPITTSMQIIPLPLAPPISYEEAKKRAKDIPRNIGYDHGKDRGTNWLRALIRYYEQDIPFPTKTTDLYVHEQGYFTDKYDEPREYPCQVEEAIVARIGPMPLVALQGEVTAPIGMRIKDAFRCQMPIMIFAYMGEHEVYIPTRELIRVDSYQARTLNIQYASPVGWSPDVADELVNGVTTMVKSIMGM